MVVAREKQEETWKCAGGYIDNMVMQLVNVRRIG